MPIYKVTVSGEISVTLYVKAQTDDFALEGAELHVLEDPLGYIDFDSDVEDADDDATVDIDYTEGLV